MTRLIALHEVDDVDHWLSSPKREELFGPMGIKVHAFTDPAGSNRTGVLLDVPDVAAFQKAMQSDAAAAAMKFDGVRGDTLVILEEA